MSVLDSMQGRYTKSDLNKELDLVLPQLSTGGLREFLAKESRDQVMSELYVGDKQGQLCGCFYGTIYIADKNIRSYKEYAENPYYSVGDWKMTLLRSVGLPYYISPIELAISSEEGRAHIVAAVEREIARREEQAFGTDVPAHQASEVQAPLGQPERVAQLEPA